MWKQSNSGDRELAVSPRRDAAFAIVHWQYLENRGLIVLNRKQVEAVEPSRAAVSGRGDR